jgi:signal transduction histidine kinase
MKATLARTGRGLDRREPVDLAVVAGGALIALRPTAHRLHLDLQTSLQAAPTEGDTRLVERLITNLVDNALHYNIDGGRVVVSTGTRAGHAFISVCNTGLVVPAADTQRLFQPFQRLGADSTDHGDGLGLGLSIVQSYRRRADRRRNGQPEPGGGSARRRDVSNNIR